MTAAKKPPKPVDDTTDAPTPAEAADVETRGVDGPFIVPFRDYKFEVPRDIINDAHFVFSLAMPGTQATIYQALGARQAGVFLALVKPGEQWVDVSNEFMTALNAAAGWGNSSPSR